MPTTTRAAKDEDPWSGERPPAGPAIVQIDAEATIVAWSAGAQALFGHAPSEAIGAPASLLLPGGKGPSEVVRRALAGESVPRQETQRVARDGRILHVSLSAQPLLGADGRVIGATAVFADLSDAPSGASADSVLRLVLDTTQEAYVAMDERGRIRDWNRAAELLFGWTREEAVGRMLGETIVPERLREAHARGLRRYLDGEPSTLLGRRLELPARRRDGAELPVELTIAPLRVGEAWMFTAFLRDITERTLAREALERSHVVHCEAQRVARMGHWEWDPRDDRATWSAEAHQIVGLEPGTAPTGALLLSLVHADDRRLVRRHADALLDGEATIEVDLRIVRPDGEERVLHVRANAVRGADGVARRVVGIIIDVTERARAEAASRRSAAVVASTEDAVVTEDRRGRITSWNIGAERLYGFSAEEAIGRTMAMVVPAALAGEEAVLLGRVLGGERLEHLETERCTKAGGPIDVSLSVSPVLDRDGRVTEVASIARDISDRKAAERELRRYTDDLAALARQDALTGLLTQRELHGALEIELARGRRDGQPCSLVLLDVDGLARVNEERGRRAGDLLLSELGAVVHRLCSEPMVACRLDGDEVAIVAPGSGPGQAMALAQRISAAWAATDPAASLSLGVASWPAEAHDKAALLARARAALRFGREAGPDEEHPAVHALRESGRADTSDRVVALLRRHLRMEIAYLSEFVDEHQIVRQVDAGPEHPDIRRGAEVPLEAGYCRRMVEAELPGVIPDTAADPVAARLAVTRTAGIGSYVGVPVRFGDGRLYGSLCCASRDPSPRLDETATHFAHVCARLIGDLLDQRELEDENRRLHGELTGVRALLAALDARDHYTGEHSEAVVELAGAVAERLGLASAHVAEVEQVALLHDIGKIGIPDSILQKPGGLTEAEWSVMHEHPAIGARIIGSIPSLAHLAPAVRAEHERWDGAGYPDRLAGEAIPLASRIILACDAYHAMTSDRPYRAALAHDAAAAELVRCSGAQFDPAVVGALLASVPGPGTGDADRTAADAGPAPARLSLLVVEDDSALRLALEHGLAAEGFVVEAVADAETAYRMAVERRPDAILLDWILVGGEGGPTACRKLRALHPEGPVLMHTGLGDLRDRQLARDAGASAFVEKGTPLPQIATDIRAAIASRL